MLGRFDTAAFTHSIILFVILVVAFSNMSPINLESPGSSQGEVGTNEDTGNAVQDVATLLRTVDFSARVSIIGGDALVVIGRL